MHKLGGVGRVLPHLNAPNVIGAVFGGDQGWAFCDQMKMEHMDFKVCYIIS